jgi:glycine/D-amino acid oxidase-like deaminating enzyme
MGGGIIGIRTALFVSERGLAVFVVEKGPLAREQSSRNWGWCRQARRDDREFDLIRHCLGPLVGNECKSRRQYRISSVRDPVRGPR